MDTQVRGKSAKRPTVKDGVCVFPSELGWMAMSWNGQQQLTRLTFGHANPVAATQTLGDEAQIEDELPATIRKIIARLQRFAAGQSDDFADIPLAHGKLTAFQASIIQACRAVKSGETISYGQLAEQCGYPKAARAVGNVMRSNRFPLIIPCHRVVGSDGKLCGFTSPQGLEMKKKLLEREGRASA